MSEDSLCKLIDELKENGVSAEISELKGGKNGEIQKVLGISVKLDFSEHDKVFEDKIAELENIINHKLGDWDKHGITYQEILDMKAENKELKQRIAELESKETEKPTKFTGVIVTREIDGQTYVTLDDFMSIVNDLQSKIGT